MVEPHAVEAILERQATLHLVGPDERGEQLVPLDRRPSLGAPGAALPVGDREEPAEVVRGMAPLGGQEGVVKVEPADSQTDVEGGRDGVEAEARARYVRPVRH